MAPAGTQVFCIECGTDSEIQGRTYSIQIFRAYTTPLVRIAKKTQSRGCVRIQYDQWPASQGKFKAFGLLYFLYRLIRGRPIRRITPNYLSKKHSRFMHVLKERVFLHPGPEPIPQKKIPKSEGLRVGTVGKRYYPDKRVDLLLESLRDIGFNGTLCVFSSDHSWTNRAAPSKRDLEYDLKIQRLISKVDFEVQVRYNLTQIEMLDSYSDLALFVLPSINEAFSTSQLEALSRGVPSIITRDNGAKSTIRQGENGFVVGVSKEELETVLRRLLFDGKALSELRRTAAMLLSSPEEKSISLAEAITVLNNRSRG